MESLVCLQILRPTRNSQGTSRPVAGHISLPRLELSDPRFMQNLCWKESARPFVSAKTKKICQLKCCNLFINKCCLQTALMFIFCVFQHGRYTKSFLSQIWLLPVSLGQPCFVLVWSGPITSQEKCIQKWISAELTKGHLTYEGTQSTPTTKQRTH